ncbi:MAG: hypothetical protein KKA60_05835 [Proteobacteria bacterium]|nr:hypothetical protein [Pseudomonadota bacterium]
MTIAASPLEERLPSDTDVRVARRQCEEVCRKELPELAWRLDPFKDTFSGSLLEEAPGEPGVLEGELKTVSGEAIELRLMIARFAPHARARAADLLEELAELSGKFVLEKPQVHESGAMSLWGAVRISARPMGVARLGGLHQLIARINACARNFRKALPENLSPTSQEKLWEPMEDEAQWVRPVPPWASDPGYTAMAIETAGTLEGVSCIALLGDGALACDWFLAHLSQACLERGQSLGRVPAISMGMRKLLALSMAAPGPVAVPAVALQIAVNPYEISGEVQAFLAAMAQGPGRIVIYGGQASLQAVFARGQGVDQDPLFPLVQRLGMPEPEGACRFALARCAEPLGGIPQKDLPALARSVMEGLEPFRDEEKIRLLPHLADRRVRQWSRGGSGGDRDFAMALESARETLGGLPTKSRSARNPAIQSSFVRVLADPGLADRLGEKILGQERSLRAAADRLAMEVLTRPRHQPIRLLLVGSAATGKSSLTARLATLLDIPYYTWDMSAIPDSHTAHSQGFGAGRGIVSSQIPGHVERTALSPFGAVLEMADADHSAVRAFVADQCLQLMETGEAQTGTGDRFSVARVIFVFTMNLPDGLDEKVHRKSIGFSNPPNEKDVEKAVTAHLKQLFGRAFISRMGSPVIFSPLSGDALAAILERAVIEAVSIALTVSGHAPKVILEKGMGGHLMQSMDRNVESFGARVLLEHGRQAAAMAIQDFLFKQKAGPAAKVMVRVDSHGRLELVPHS